MLYRALSAPTSAQVELTTRCSNNCPHCYNYQRQDDDPDTTMTIEQVQRTIGQLGDAQVFSATITGGEPGLEPALLVEAIRLCNERGIKCSINTNLTTLREETLVQMLEAGKFTVMTSLASYDEDVHDAMMGRTGAYTRTLRGIELLKRHEVAFFANMVVAQLNAGQVYDTGMFAYTIGAKAFSATKASPPLGCLDYSAIQPKSSQVKHSLDDLLRINQETGMSVDILECYPLCFLGDLEKYARFTRRSCSAAIFSGTVGADGQVRPCSHSNRTYGSLFEEDLPLIYSRMTEWRSGELLPKVCLVCNYFSRCSGGCRCEAEYAGSIDGMDPYASNEASVVAAPKSAEACIEVNEDTKISVVPSVVFRDEEFGYLLKSRRAIAMVGPEAGFLLRKLQESSMTLDEASLYSGFAPEDVLPVLKGLVVKKMVELK